MTISIAIMIFGAAVAFAGIALLTFVQTEGGEGEFAWGPVKAKLRTPTAFLVFFVGAALVVAPLAMERPGGKADASSPATTNQKGEATRADNVEPSQPRIGTHPEDTGDESLTSEGVAFVLAQFVANRDGASKNFADVRVGDVISVRVQALRARAEPNPRAAILEVYPLGQCLSVRGLLADEGASQGWLMVRKASCGT